MNENDSFWKKWQVRVTTVAGLFTILSFLLIWSPKGRDMIGEVFGRKPAAIAGTETGNHPGTPEPVRPDKDTPEGSKPGTKPSGLKPLPEQYINTAISRREGTSGAAILVRQESGESLSDLELGLASLLAKRGVEPVRSFFKPAFIQEGRAKSLFDGDWTISEQLGLGRRVDYVLIGFGKVTYSSNQELGGLLTANFELELKCLNVVTRRVCDSKTFITPGAGYTQGTALQNAVEHLQPRLESFIREAF
jgi:hypothetical protein